MSLPASSQRISACPSSSIHTTAYNPPALALGKPIFPFERYGPKFGTQRPRQACQPLPEKHHASFLIRCATAPIDSFHSLSCPNSPDSCCKRAAGLYCCTCRHLIDSPPPSLLPHPPPLPSPNAVVVPLVALRAFFMCDSPASCPWLI